MSVRTVPLLETVDYWLSIGLAIGLGRPAEAVHLLELRRIANWAKGEPQRLLGFLTRTREDSAVR